MTESYVSKPFDRDRMFIVSVWLIGLCLNFGLVWYADVTEYRFIGVPPEHFREPINGLYFEVLISYAPYVATMLAIIFATRKKSSKGRRGLFILAFLISVGLNLIWVGQTFRVAFLHTLDIQGLSEWLQGYIKNLGFLVNGFLAYYYSSVP